MFPHRPGGWKSKIKTLTELVSSEAALLGKWTAIFPLCAFVSLPLKNISVIVKEGTTLYQHDLILTNYICNNPESESHSVVSDSLRPHGLYSPWNS